MSDWNWRTDNNRCVTDLIREESDLTVIILYQNDIQRASIMRNLRHKLGGAIQDRSSLWSLILRNRSCVRLVPLQRSQIELKGISISLLLFPDSIEYSIKNQITRELAPQLLRGGGYSGSVGSIRV